MPRLPRKYSETGIYHIMVRGNARENIFADNQDKGKLLKIVLEKKNDGLFLLYAYCIMNNHAHFVLKEIKETISNSMRRITTSYAAYFNKKYHRVGHVFQDRFKSQVVENDSYLLSVIRYIHNNPEKASILDKEEYPWSSYQIYISQDKNNKLPEITDIFKYFSIKNTTESIQLFKAFSNQYEKKEFLGIKEGKEINHYNVNLFLETFLKTNNIKKSDLNNHIYNKLVKVLAKELSKKYDLSGRSIAEIIGVNREKIRNILIRVSKEPSL